MSKKILLKKTCSVYASNLHLATMIFPFINKEMKKGAIVKTILEKNISEDIEKIINHVQIESKIKNKIEKIDWSQSNIEKIKETLENLEKNLNSSNKIHIIVAGSNIFIDKINKLVDLWTKINLDKIENNNIDINIINCYNFEDNDQIDNILSSHEYILKTTGLEEIYEEEKLKKAN